ncbi:uncharacterized protein K460DRAFT_350038 [Cucurbitaria berberidis CBS 394.84]|uniref:Uncharacterized protein n=1 Tax=Cucurbitaria berberidis CBS 394.84 TaxID=1168544 RepID=A0A9P4LBS2_9PLEO|nr:uncharacterized protein K460DRAFT_350038 [Cucurbitaria berberidis CBS 394.84]KAF1849906.1 hypothetical protein K460DRAFT_350038 [Cucurbitaria berberidis CBS 394.84]
MNLSLAFLFLSHLLCSVQSLRFIIPRADPPQLGIQRSTFTQHTHGGKLYNWYMYSAVVTYSDNVNTLFKDDAQVAGLAYQAFEEALRLSQDPFSVTGVAVLLVGNQAIFATTLKNFGNTGVLDTRYQFPPNFFYDIIPSNAALHQQLLACQIAYGGRNFKHIHKGNCGEIVAMQIWHLANPEKVWPKDAGARTAFWSNTGQTWPPCNANDAPNAWGCKQWAGYNGISWPQRNFVGKDSVTLSTHTPVQSVSYNSLWCEGWEERANNRPPSPDLDEGIDSDEWEAAMQGLN